MKKTIVSLLAFLLIFLCACSTRSAEKAVLSLEKAKEISELAVLDCVYHTVGIYENDEEKKVLWMNFGKKLWREAEYIVTLGINAENLQMSVSGTDVTISLPPIEIQGIELRTDFEPIYYTEKGILKANSDDAAKTAESARAKVAENIFANDALILQAEDRVKFLLEGYINSFSHSNDVDYTIHWQTLETSPETPDTATTPQEQG